MRIRQLAALAVLVILAGATVFAGGYTSTNNSNKPESGAAGNVKSCPDSVAEQLKYLLRDLTAPLKIQVMAGNVIVEGIIKTQADNLRFEEVMKRYKDQDIINTVRVEAEKVLIDVGVTLVEVEQTNGHNVSILDPSDFFGAIDAGLSYSWQNENSLFQPNTALSWSLGVSDRILQSIRLAVNSGKARIVARPRVVTNDGEAASLLAGGEIPFSSSGLGFTNTDYREYGIKLDVTPELLPTGEVEMDLGLEVSRPTTVETEQHSFTGTLALDTRRAHVKVAVAKGKSLVLAGLSDETTVRRHGWGFLFPLFSSKSDVRRRELLVLVTPNAPSVLGYDSFKMIQKKDVEK